MLVVYDERELLHKPKYRIFAGEMRPHTETFERVPVLLDALKKIGLDIAKPADHGMDGILAVHDANYAEFLRTGYDEWKKIPGVAPEMRMTAHPNEYMHRLPDAFIGRAGFYLGDAGCVLNEGSWDAIWASANVAVDAGRRVVKGGAKQAFALCRPPGHHAYKDRASGFCYFNNTAIAAQCGASAGARVAVIDVDVHHGNGTQGVFYERGDVFTISIHGDPAQLYPFFTGYADERGAGKGEGANLNLPVPLLSGDDVYLSAVEEGMKALHNYAPDYVVVSLGLDAASSDPFACMNVSTQGFRRMGEICGGQSKPTIMVMEGGYMSPELGSNLEAFVTGFLNKRK